MPIIVNLDVMTAKRKVSLNELSERVDLTLSNLSILKTGKAKVIRFGIFSKISREREKGINTYTIGLLTCLVSYLTFY
jgi:putative transcriptional regulator